MALDERIKHLGHCVYQAADGLKGQDIRALDLTETESYTDLVFIISGSSHRQVQAIADKVREDMAKICGVRPLGIEGMDAGEWVLLDFGDIVVHVFLDEKRPEYKLEEMWPNVNTLSEGEIPKFLKKRPAKAPKKAAAKKVPVAKKETAPKKAKAPRKKKTTKAAS